MKNNNHRPPGLLLCKKNKDLFVKSIVGQVFLLLAENVFLNYIPYHYKSSHMSWNTIIEIYAN